MQKLAFLVAFVVLSIAATSFVTPAFAQATRTWVSGVGDDANPCSRTAPCKTFAGAISKTAAGGEINCLDPGGFGGVTITKSMAIQCDFTEGGVLVAGTNGIVINDCSSGTPGTAVVFLAGMDILGVSGATNGINFICGKSLHVKNAIIRGFATNAILFAPTSASGSTANLTVQDSTIADNPGGGIKVAPGAGINATGAVSNTVASRNTFGIRVEDRAKVTAFQVTAVANTGNGFLAVGSAAASELNVVRSVAVNTATNGVATSGANATVRLLDSAAYDNANGLNSTLGGTIAGTTPDTNAIAGSTSADGAVNGNVTLQ